MTDDAYVAELRKLFPVVERWTYLYNGGIHPCPTPVGDAMRAFLAQWEQGGRDAWPPARAAFNRLKERFASLIHARAEDIVVTESTTAGINLAAQILRPRADQNVVVTDLAFMSNTYPWLVSHPGVDVRFVRSRNGRVHLDDVAPMMDENTAALHICAVTVGSGFRYDLSAVHALTKANDVPLLVDGAQALGLVDIDVVDPSIDFLVGTAGKWLMGPAGVGFLYVGDRFKGSTPPAAGWFAAANQGDWDLEHPVLFEEATRFQGGMPNLIGVVGALAALELHERIGREFIAERVAALTSHALGGLEEIGVDLWTPRPAGERAGIVFFRDSRHDELYAKLREARIYCGHFLGGIRIEPHFYNTLGEIDSFLKVVRAHV